jgi:hypothetical protein
MKEVKYKLWIEIEKITITDDDEIYEDCKNVETKSVGTFDSLKDAYDQMEMLESRHVNDTSVCYKGHYSSIHNFIETNSLEAEANKLFGEDWEAEDDIQQIRDLLNSIDRVYRVEPIEEITKRDFRTDDYIHVF